EKDAKGSAVKYDVYLADGTEIEFDGNGEWISVDAPAGAAVPAGIVPAPIADFVAYTYPNEKINEISRDSRGYEVELTNEVDLIFGIDGSFIRIEKK
ncbi:MAG: PepSY-like domain-containing protein, partial [Muribaculaceae bacterium]|nr:PepSY-like domain-containing protein [Muribaculaceae bacterium]